MTGERTNKKNIEPLNLTQKVNLLRILMWEIYLFYYEYNELITIILLKTTSHNIYY